MKIGPKIVPKIPEFPNRRMKEGDIKLPSAFSWTLGTLLPLTPLPTVSDQGHGLPGGGMRPAGGH